MINISEWLKDFLNALDETFSDRVWFVGLQGSYGRGEATDSSDIDTVVFIVEFITEYIFSYDKMLILFEHRELVCGFISGKKEIYNWETADLFQFYYDTKAIKGSLDELKPVLDVDRAVKIGVCNIYHGCVHNMLHEKSEEILKSLYKSASFVLQAMLFKRTGKYISFLTELAELLSPDEKIILENFLKIKNGEKSDFDSMSRKLFEWSRSYF
ncbi:MAG: nucleotidyltransferase domain-containing protein [Clostridia bacterium]|nr:nucleotidyltransferase domain-containing protein [Clostridia bacterium]